MRYNKHTKEDYIVGIGTGDGGVEITREEYEALRAVIEARPTPAEGFGYRLRTDLTWEEYELPPIEEPEPSETPTTEEMLEAIKEGVNEV